MAKQSSGRSRSAFAEAMIRVHLMRYKLGQIGPHQAVDLLVTQGKVEPSQAETLLRTADQVKIDRKLLERYGYDG